MRLRELASLFFLLATTANAGDITGAVRLAGKEPSNPMREVVSDIEVCGERSRPAHVLALGTNQTVRDAIVYLGAVDRNGLNHAATNAPAVLDQRGCDFVPRVQIVRSGATLVVRNSDPVLQVVRIDSMNSTNAAKTLLTAATPYAGFEKKFQLANFREPTLLKAINLNGHDWMAGYIAVMPHPWAALTDAGGRFTLRDVPTGSYKLYAWHEALGTLVRDVRVNGDRSTTIDLEFAGAK